MDTLSNRKKWTFDVSLETGSTKICGGSRKVTGKLTIYFMVASFKNLH